MARMKFVHPPQMVAHLWAHQTQDSARVATGNFYFQGDTIYSYGSHFPVARIIERKKQKAVLFNDRTYSSTTSGHQSCVRGACRHMTVFCVAHPTANYENSSYFDAQWETYEKRLAELTGNFCRAKTNKRWIWDAMKSLVEMANDFAKFFGSRRRLKLPNKEQAEKAIKEADRKARVKAKQKKTAAEKARAEAMLKLADDIEKWKAGTLNYLPHWCDKVLLRIDNEGENLETSKGVEVPLDHARKAFRVLAKLRSSGETFKTNGQVIRVGVFKVDSMDGQGVVKAGCHTVEWDEIERVARLAGEA